jgi:3-methylfumaryl-CoA hydratase
VTEPAPDPASAVGRLIDGEDVVTAALVERFRATLAPHAADPAEDGEAPLGLHWCLAPEAVPMARLGADGHVGRGPFLPQMPELPRRMWAGGEIEHLAPLRIGDAVRRRSRIASVARKEGKSGALVFIAVEHAFESPRGLAVRERQDLVFRGAGGASASPQPSAPTGPAPEPDGALGGDLAFELETDPVLLFRYSALTFNGHRIHYDAPYATGVEGYGGLVVQGALQATFLLHAAIRLHPARRPPARFAYRGLQALLVGAPARLLARLDRADGSVRADVRDVRSGRTTMAAAATW